MASRVIGRTDKRSQVHFTGTRRRRRGHFANSGISHWPLHARRAWLSASGERLLSFTAPQTRMTGVTTVEKGYSDPGFASAMPPRSRRSCPASRPNRIRREVTTCRASGYEGRARIRTPPSLAAHLLVNCPRHNIVRQRHSPIPDFACQRSPGDRFIQTRLLRHSHLLALELLDSSKHPRGFRQRFAKFAAD